jgi:hypothetical protein
MVQASEFYGKIEDWISKNHRSLKKRGKSAVNEFYKRNVKKSPASTAL